MEIKNVSLYNRAVERVLRKEALKSLGGELPKKSEELKAIEDEYKAKLKEISKKVIAGELDREIKKEMYLIQLEEKLREAKSGEER